MRRPREKVAAVVAAVILADLAAIRWVHNPAWVFLVIGLVGMLGIDAIKNRHVADLDRLHAEVQAERAARDHARTTGRDDLL